MKNGMICAKKTTWRARLDLEYLDETSERKESARRYAQAKYQQSDAGQKLKQFADYASKETLGQVHAGGFLHHRIIENPDGSRTAPSQLTNDERKKRISAVWHEHLRQIPTSSENPVLQHRLVFSMSTELHDKLVDAGIRQGSRGRRMSIWGFIAISTDSIYGDAMLMETSLPAARRTIKNFGRTVSSWRPARVSKGGSSNEPERQPPDFATSCITGLLLEFTTDSRPRSQRRRPRLKKTRRSMPPAPSKTQSVRGRGYSRWSGAAGP